MEEFASTAWLRRLITLVMLAVLVLLGFRVLDPFIVPLVWAGILAYVTWPAYIWLLGRWRGHSIAAALVMTVIISAAVVAPIAWLAVVVRVELMRDRKSTRLNS